MDPLGSIEKQIPCIKAIGAHLNHVSGGFAEGHSGHLRCNGLKMRGTQSFTPKLLHLSLNLLTSLVKLLLLHRKQTANTCPHDIRI